MITFKEFITLSENKAKLQSATFAQQLQDYEREKESKEKLLNRAQKLKQRQRRKADEFKRKSRQEMERQAQLKASSQDDADDDLQQSKETHRRNITSMSSGVKRATKSTLKGGARLIKYASRKLRGRGR